jgi:hypothetical protein
MSTTAIEEFAAKTEVPSWARTADWDQVPAALRRRSFFSAALEDARALSAERKAVADLLQGVSKVGETGGRPKLYRRDTAITELQAMMQSRGLDTGEGDTLTNPAAEQRIKLVIDTNRAQAQGYARFKRSSSGGALLAFPAQELVRVRPSKVERDWRARWTEAGGSLTGGRMIALKTDPIWTALNRFGVPYPPFDFNSGMGVRDISRRECLELGLIQPDYAPGSDPVGDFNANVEADVSAVHPDLLASVADLFGTAVQLADGIMKLLT